MIDSYVELVMKRLEGRHEKIISALDDLTERDLRFTVRIFGDCLDDEKRKELLGNYTEYWTESELRGFVRNFVPAYAEYALAELVEKKKDGERFDPPFLTQEEYQEMAVREKWPKIAAHMAHMTPHQLRREISKAGMLFRPYMLDDPGFNEGVLEFALYFDLLGRLELLSLEELRALAQEIAPLVDRAVSTRRGEESESILREVRERVAEAAGIGVDPETLLGPEMERYPREAPAGWKVRELRNTLKTMPLGDLRLAALSHLDLLTMQETREIVTPFLSRYPSFFGIPSVGLQDLVLAIAEKISDRAITFFFDRYASGRMAMTPPVAYLVWKLMPREEKLSRLLDDNARMDQAMMSRHLARFLLSAATAELADADRQIALLTDPRFSSTHGLILVKRGSDEQGTGVRRLYDEVTAMALRMMFLPAGERDGKLGEIRRKIAAAAGIDSPAEITEGGS